MMTITSQADCQSCGMPMTAIELFGTDEQRNQSAVYCKYCYEQGAFLQPDLTLEGMVELCTSILVKEGREEQPTRSMLQAYLPTLKRWSAGNTAGPDRIESHPGLHLAGLSVRTTNAREATVDGLIPGLCERYSGGVGNTLAESSSEPETVYGLYYNYTEDGANGAYSVLVGAALDDADKRPPTAEELVYTDVPFGSYAVFVSRRGPIPQIVIETWQRIWNSEASGMISRTFTGDFERYDERSRNPEDAIVAIYVAVR